MADTPVRMFRPAYASLDVFERTATSGADGIARFEGLSGDGWAFVDPQPTRLGGVVWKRVTLPASGEVGVDVVLPKGRAIRGRVTDAKTGAGIAGARVAIGWVMTTPVTTDAEGRYEILGWHDAQGADDLHAAADGYARSAVIVGDRDVVDFPLTRGVLAIGRVVDGGGKPLAGVLVGCVDVGEEAGRVEGDINGTARTGRDGRFRLSDLRPDTPHALVFLGAGLARTLLDVPPPKTEGGTIDVGDVVLRAGRRIEGRVLDAEGRPVVGQRVGLEGANEDRHRLLGVPLAARPPSYGQEEEAYTDDLGRFRFPDLAPGTYTLSVRLPGGEIPPREVPLGADADVLGVDLRVEDGRDLVVRVRDARGEALAQAFVSAFGPQSQGVSGVTDAKGALTLRVTRGTWKVNVHWSKELDAKGRKLLDANGVEVTDADDEVEIRLEDAGVPHRRRARSRRRAPAPGDRGRRGGRAQADGDADGRAGTLRAGGRRSGPLRRARDGAARRGESGADLRARRGAPRPACGRRRRDRGRASCVRRTVRSRSWWRRRRARRSPARASRSRDGTDARGTSPRGTGGASRCASCPRVPSTSSWSPRRAQRERWVFVQRLGVVPEGQTVTIRLRVGVAGRRDRAGGGRARRRRRRRGRATRRIRARPAPWSTVTDAAGRFRLLVDPEVALPLLVRAMPAGVDPTTVEVPSLDTVELTIRLAGS